VRDASYADAIADTLTASELPDHAVGLTDLLAGKDATDDEAKL
jgi:hypothetical protein